MALAVTDVGVGNVGGTGANISTSAPFTATANALVLVYVVNYTFLGNPLVPTVADDGDGYTWTQINTDEFIGNDAQFTMFAAQMDASPASMTITATFASGTSKGIFVLEVTGHDTVLGVSAILQSAVASGTGSPATVTLASTPDTDNMVLCGYVFAPSAATRTNETDWVELVDTDSATWEAYAQYRYTSAGDTTSSPTFSGASPNWSGILVEIREAPSAAITGTATASINESDIVTGGKTVIITLKNATWIAAGAASFDLQRDEIIAGMDSAQSELLGWDNVVKALQSLGGVVRTSDTVVTITLDAQATYNITATETITVTVPSTSITEAVAIVATPTFTVSPVGAAKGKLVNGGLVETILLIGGKLVG